MGGYCRCVSGRVLQVREWEGVVCEWEGIAGV